MGCGTFLLKGYQSVIMAIGRGHDVLIISKSSQTIDVRGWVREFRVYCQIATILEGPYIQLLGNKAPTYHTIEGNMGPNSLLVVYVEPLGI